jgi:hypothetical protein
VTRRKRFHGDAALPFVMGEGRTLWVAVLDEGPKPKRGSGRSPCGRCDHAKEGHKGGRCNSCGCDLYLPKPGTGNTRKRPKGLPQTSRKETGLDNVSPSPAMFRTLAGVWRSGEVDLTLHESTSTVRMTMPSNPDWQRTLEISVISGANRRWTCRVAGKLAVLSIGPSGALRIEQSGRDDWLGRRVGRTASSQIRSGGRR